MRAQLVIKSTLVGVFPGEPRYAATKWLLTDLPGFQEVAVTVRPWQCAVSHPRFDIRGSG